MKKLWLIATMLCLLAFPVSAFAATSDNAKAFASEETIATQWIDTMLTKNQPEKALTLMSQDAQSNVKPAQMKEIRDRMTKELGTLKTSRFISWTRFDQADQFIYLMGFDKSPTVRCELLFKKDGTLENFNLTPFTVQQKTDAKTSEKK